MSFIDDLINCYQYLNSLARKLDFVIMHLGAGSGKGQINVKNKIPVFQLEKT